MTSFVSIQHSLNAGEITPSLWGRIDLDKWKNGTSTCRNFFVNYRGGVVSRAGFAYVGTCLQEYPALPPRDIPFQFNLNQGYALEFGTEYMRVKSNGAYVTEIDNTNHNITAITAANPAVLTINANHGYSVGDWIYIYGAKGITSLDGQTWIVNTVPTAATLTLTDLYGNVVSTVGEGPYTSGGKVERIFTLDTPYAAEDLPYLKYAQSADVMTLTCVNPETGTEYPPYSLTRLDNDDWTLVADTFGTEIDTPANLSAVAYASTTPSTWYSYVVTAVDRETGEESTASDAAHIQNNDLSLYQGSNVLSWDPVEGASSYNVYAAPPSYGFTTPTSSIFGYIGTALGPSFTDNNTVPDYTVVPPVHYDPFAIAPIIDVVVSAGGSNYSTQTVGYTVSTATGTGFDGFPVVANGSVAGFVITNQGQNYADVDTISFTDTGGGVATGSYTVVTNATNGSTVTINGFVVTFAAQNRYKNPSVEVLLGGTIADTLQSMANFLNSKTDTATLINATYTYDATHLYITYKSPGAVGNAFTLGVGPAGWTRSAATLTGGGTVGTGATGTLTVGEESGTYPSVPAYYQQRRVYANSQNKPDTYWMSQPGLFSNMDTSIPVTDSDSITGTPWSQQVDGIQFMVPMPGGLVVLTGKSAWQINGGSQAALTPSNQTAVAQAYNGCNDTVQPLTINYDILYIQSKGSIARDLAYNFYTNIYTGSDLTIFSNHLFNYNDIVQWCWCEEPYKLVWAVRNDGVLLCLTYLKEQEVFAWSRHDTNGKFLSVCSVTEPPIDALYVITQRYINGAWRYYSERMNDRLWNTVEESFCVDMGVSYPVPNVTSGLAYTLTYPEAGFSASQPTPLPTGTLNIETRSGTDVSFTVTGGTPFTASQVGYIIRAGGGKAEIVSYVSTSEVLCDIIEEIIQVTPDDPDERPLPVASGDWSIAVPTTIVRNLDHLEGMTVSVLADGGVYQDVVVEDGQIELDQENSLITIGLPYTCQVQTMYIENTSDGNTSQNRRKLIKSVGVRVEATRGLSIGSDQVDASTQQGFNNVPWTDMIEIKGRAPTTDAGTAMPLYTGDEYINISSTWTPRGQIAAQQTYPLPATILSFISYWELGDNR